MLPDDAQRDRPRKNLKDREKFRQKARRSRTSHADDDVSIPSEISEIFDLVPEIGNGYRWYDWPHNLLWWLGTGWRANAFPRLIRVAIWRGINYLNIFNEHDRNKAKRLDGWMYNLHVPSEEHVTMPRFTLVELFPPSDLPSLEMWMAKFSGVKGRPDLPDGQTGQESLSRSRSGQGAVWWALATFVGKEFRGFSPRAIRVELPSSIHSVSMQAVQVGTSLTAVVASFSLSNESMRSLDNVWHTQHEPLILRSRGKRARTLDRHWASIHLTQTARAKLHETARAWLARNLQGYFVRNETPQPLLDLMLFDTFDPTKPPPRGESREQRILATDALRAIGLERDSWALIASDSLPKLVLQSGWHFNEDPLGNVPTWTLLGNRTAILNALGPDALKYTPGDENQGIANLLIHRMNNLWVMLAVSHLLEDVEARYAAIRDHARERHGKFNVEALKELRNTFLSLSLDLVSVQRDVTAFWERPYRWDADAEFLTRPGHVRNAVARKKKKSKQVEQSFNDGVKDGQIAWFASLRESDKDYREILATVASLGSSADSFRVSRWALSVAMVSLVVAAATIMLTNIGCESIATWLFGVHTAQCQVQP